MPLKTFDLDLSWKNPPKEQLAALEFACKKKVKVGGRELPNFVLLEATIKYQVENSDYLEIAEFVCLGEDSLWYTQAKLWKETPPNVFVDEQSKEIWKSSCKLICDIVESGYDAQLNMWWSHTLTPITKLVLSDFGIMLETYRKGSLAIVSTGFDIFLKLVLGNGWRSKYKKTFRVPQEPKECIDPNCTNMVADIGVKNPPNGVYKNYRATDACQRGHNGYFCQKCKLPHSYVTKIGINHYSKEVHDGKQ